MARPRLTDRLTADADVPLIGVIGPAGYGKTTLLAQVAASDRRAVAWLTLDERDTDPMGLLRYVAAAVDRATGLPGSVLGSVGGPDPTDWQTALSQLGDALARTRQPLLLVLDDVERIVTGESCEAIVALASLLPAGSQLALASRRAGRPPGPSPGRGRDADPDRTRRTRPRRRGGRRAAADRGPAAARRGAAELNHAMEVWAAGLYLSAVTHRAGVDGAEEDDLTAGRRIVADYLHDEILASLPRDEVELALRASLLDRLDAGIVEAVVGVTDADRILRDLARTTPLLIELDDGGDWYRWHRSLHEPLVAELRHRGASAEAALLERAQGSYERAGLLERRSSTTLCGRRSRADRAAPARPRPGSVERRSGGRGTGLVRLARGQRRAATRP